MALARSFVRFAVVGAIATAIHAAVFAALIETTRIDPVAATVVAFAAAFGAGFVLNRRWTFGSRAAPPAWCRARGSNTPSSWFTR